MDLVAGLSAASTAIGIAKDLREIDRGVDEATYKLKLAELASALADTKLALADAKTKISDLSSEIAKLSEGDICPKCKNGRQKVISFSQHASRSMWQWHKCECDNPDCDYEATRLFDTGAGNYMSKALK